jgi:hypothetical protein
MPKMEPKKHTCNAPSSDSKSPLTKKPNIKAFSLPFTLPFVRLISPCNSFLQGKLNGFQVDLLKPYTNINIIISILACFAKSMAKT